MMMPSSGAKSALLSRRSLIALVPATLLVQACTKGAGKADENWLAFGSTTKTIDHAAWDGFLARYVKSSTDGINRVAYKDASNTDRNLLRPYIETLEKIEVSGLARDEQFAFWVNLYNAATVDLIIQKYPVDSIRDIGTLGMGPWSEKRLKVEGRDLSLDDIEHTILRPIWKDVRIHYAVNCASLGCPNLATKAWRSDQLEPMLNAAAVAFINHPRGFAMIDGALVASNIFEWYRVDWGSPQKVLEHARAFASGPSAAMLAKATSIDSYNYDWSLNAVA